MQVSGIEVKAFCFGNVECEVLQDIQMGVLSMYLDMRVQSSSGWLGMTYKQMVVD